MKANVHTHDRKISPVTKAIGMSLLILLGLSTAFAINREMDKPHIEESSSYAYAQLGEACNTAIKNYDSHINDLKSSNDQINASLDKALQAVKASSSTDPSIYASYNSIATNASTTIAANNTKVEQLSDRRAQLSVCVDKAASHENFLDNDVSNYRTLIAESGN